jgi:hypothetical protein
MAAVIVVAAAAAVTEMMMDMRAMMSADNRNFDRLSLSLDLFLMTHELHETKVGHMMLIRSSTPTDD